MIKPPAVQLVRIADVLFVGPLLLYAGTKTTGTLSRALTVIGALTISYNGLNFLIEANKS